MKATKLQSFCRGVALVPRKRPRPCLSETRPLFAARRFTSCPSLRASLRDTQSNHDRELETQRQLEQMQLDDEFSAAPPIDFDAQDSKPDPKAGADLLRKLRVIPRSPSYFSARPVFTDSYVHLHALYRKYAHLPTVTARAARRKLWTEYDTYVQTVGEKVRSSRYNRVVEILRRLNLIHPKLMPAEVRTALDSWTRDMQPFNNKATPITVDELGRAIAIGRRKASAAKAWVVEGEGEVLVNGKPLHQAFSRVHDRESVIWPLKVTQRVDKYNVFALVRGGGTTGQAEAITLAVSKALVAHEAALKPLLRKAGCVTRDPRRVERKKPGKRKARKMPAWVKR